MKNNGKNANKNSNSNKNGINDKNKKKNNNQSDDKPLSSALKKNKDEPERTSKTVKFFDDVKNQDNFEKQNEP